MVENLIFNIKNLITTYSFLGPLAAFLGGVLLSFSPCIYPLIPVTLGIIGVTTINSRGKGFLISLVFVLGIATTYTFLGILASLLGIFLGKIYTFPFIHLFLGLLFFFLGLSLWGVFSLPFFNLSWNYKPKKGWASLYLLGIFSGLGVTPCALPVLGTILTLISQKGNVIYGAVTLFFFSLGYGFLLLLLGIFSSLIWRLPKSGPWLIIIRKILALGLVAIALYFFGNFFRFL